MSHVMPWSFEERRKRSVKRDPFEAEFFTGEEDTEEMFGRTDALVREAIQNSLDARPPGSSNGPVRVRFALSSVALPSPTAGQYLEGLVPHLNALGNELVALSKPVPPMKFLVVEDFGTMGLCGDPARTDDPKSHDPADPQSFYWFWRNVGRSGKAGTDRGRWGLGKTVFPATSRINTIFGFTVRKTDSRRMLMGQAITRIHATGGKEFEPEGFFHDATASAAADLQMPFESDQKIDTFIKDFGLLRGKDPGLSIVVPYPFEKVSAQEIFRSVIVHYFYSILRNDLEVTVEGPDFPVATATSKNISELSTSFKWNGSRKEKKHAAPPFAFASWAIERQHSGMPFTLQKAGVDRVPEWSPALISESDLSRLRELFQRGERIAVRVPMTIEKKGGLKMDSYFDVFIEQDQEMDRGDDYFVRGGMTISRITMISSHRGIRGLVVVDDLALSTLLGDAEGPAHTEWGTGETRPDASYVKWKSRIAFVKHSLGKLLWLLAPPPEELDENWLRDIFSIDAPQKGGKKKKGLGNRRRDDKELPPPPPSPPPRRPKTFDTIQVKGGFRITSIAGAPQSPARIRVQVAYDIPDGNPFDVYSPFDFTFDSEGLSALKIQQKGVELEESSQNTLLVRVKDPDFDLTITGFDKLRDLYIAAAAEMKEES